MKRGAILLATTLLITGIGKSAFSQNCSYSSAVSVISVDTICSPVQADWSVSFSGVQDNESSVEIEFNWGDGVSVKVAANEVNEASSQWQANASHTYTTASGECAFILEARLVVNGLACEFSVQQEEVRVWDLDNAGGASIRPYPGILEVCQGASGSYSFSDSSMLNCLSDPVSGSPNSGERWVQWIYGTKNTLGGSAVQVGGSVETYPFEGQVIKLENPISTPGGGSLPITLMGDHPAGGEFEVELRYWNHCNPYKPGPPAPYASEKAVLRIVELPDPEITEIDSICESALPVNLQASPPGGLWSGAGVDPASGLFSPAIAGAGTHQIIYTIPIGTSCAPADTISIVVKDAIEVNISPQGLLCMGDAAVQLSATPTGGSWSGPGIIDADAGIFDQSVAGPGRHNILYTLPQGGEECPAYGIIEIPVAAPPFAEFLSADSSWCSTTAIQRMAEIMITGADSTSFDLVVDVRGMRDTLFLPAAGLSAFLTDNAFGDNIYRLVKIIEYHGEESCERLLSDALVFQVNEMPDLQLIAEYEGSCSPLEVRFSATEGYLSYRWDFGDKDTLITGARTMEHSYSFRYEDVAYSPDDSIVIDDEGIIIVYPGDSTLFLRNDTTYQVTLYAQTDNGCVNILHEEIFVQPSPKVNFFVGPDVLYFPDSAFVLANLTSLGPWEYYWDFGDTTFLAQEEPEEHIYQTWGNYDIELKASSAFCSDSMSQQVRIIPPPPRAAFNTDSAGCPPYIAAFNNTSEYGSDYFWDFGDGSTSNEKHPEHTYFTQGEYEVELVVTGLNGRDTSWQTLVVMEPPEAAFSADPVSSGDLAQVFAFTNQSIDGSYYLWDFGDGTTSASDDPTHVYGEAGDYSVTLYAWGENNCVDTLSKAAYIQLRIGEGSVEFPNVFRWNGSGPTGGVWHPGEKNPNIFHPQVVNVLEYTMFIYSRWGDQLFESRDLYIGWDGYLESGKLAHEGVYVYKALVKYVDGKTEILAGDVTFLH